MVGGEPAKQPAQSHPFALCFVLRHTSFFKLRLLGLKEQHAEVSRPGAPITRTAGFFSKGPARDRLHAAADSEDDGPSYRDASPHVYTQRLTRRDPNDGDT